MGLSKRAFAYGVVVWVGLVLVSLVLLPLESAKAPLYESLKLTALVALGLALTVSYLRHRTVRGVLPGAFIGLVWALTCIVGDLCLYLAGAFPFGLDVYFVDVASSYAVLPLIAGLAMGYLQPKVSVVVAGDGAVEVPGEVRGADRAAADRVSAREPG
jgi:hypothetical protein